MLFSLPQSLQAVIAPSFCRELMRSLTKVGDRRHKARIENLRVYD